ncbi:MAG: carbamoyl-phosphate synthase large subunit, partial [Candidatus Hydrogenedentes bacterium]|nr:carbamoyl-phosphate synthase large subunit [Candidatus Hydrogenedentota bacterium]
EPEFVSAKEVVLPFIKFPGVDILLGPEMRSTGEVMGIDKTMGMAFAKSQVAAGNRLPEGGAVFISLNDRDKRKMGALGKDLAALGFSLLATEGTAALLRDQGIDVERVFKVGEKRPNIVDRMINGDVHWVINTPLGGESMFDEKPIRRTALERGITHMTTLAAARAAVMALKAERAGAMAVRSLQEYHEDAGARPALAT